MLSSILVILQYLIPLSLVAIPFLLFFDISPKKPKEEKTEEQPTTLVKKPNMHELEDRLQHLLETNHTNSRLDTLKKELQSTQSNTIAAYISLNKKDLKGFHLFQLIFSLIKNQAEDAKIIKILRHYLPSCANTHLHAMLYAFKIFLKISNEDGRQKELLKELNQNKVRTTLLYLEQKLNQTLNKVPTVPPAMQQLFIDQAVIYGLVFAAFSEFYDNEATEKILRLVHQLSPDLFKYWHKIPEINYIDTLAGFEKKFNSQTIATAATSQKNLQN